MTIPDGVEIPQEQSDKEVDEEQRNTEVLDLHSQIRKLRSESAAMQNATKNLKATLASVGDHVNKLEKATTLFGSPEFASRLQDVVRDSNKLEAMRHEIVSVRQQLDEKGPKKVKFGHQKRKASDKDVLYDIQTDFLDRTSKLQCSGSILEHLNKKLRASANL